MFRCSLNLKYFVYTHFPFVILMYAFIYAYTCPYIIQYVALNESVPAAVMRSLSIANFVDSVSCMINGKCTDCINI